MSSPRLNVFESAEFFRLSICYEIIMNDYLVCIYDSEKWSSFRPKHAGAFASETGVQPSARLVRMGMTAFSLAQLAKSGLQVKPSLLFVAFQFLSNYGFNFQFLTKSGFRYVSSIMILRFKQMPFFNDAVDRNEVKASFCAEVRLDDLISCILYRNLILFTMLSGSSYWRPICNIIRQGLS